MQVPSLVGLGSLLKEKGDIQGGSKYLLEASGEISAPVFSVVCCVPFTILACVVLLLKNVTAYVFSRVQADSSSLGTRAQTVGRFKKNSSIFGDVFTRASSAEKGKTLKSVSQAGSKNNCKSAPRTNAFLLLPNVVPHITCPQSMSTTNDFIMCRRVDC